jgi:surfeit locus 1 family protein
MNASSDMPEMPTLVISRGEIWGSIIVVVVALVCVRLGVWQLDRLEQKRARNATTLQRMSEPPVDLNQIADIRAAGDTTGLIFRRTVLDGAYDDARTVVIAGRSLRGVPGVHILTPMRIGPAAVLVNRGWMPSADAAHVQLDSIIEPPPEDLNGLLTPYPEDYGRPPRTGTFQRVWYQMNAQQLRDQFPYPVLPVIAQILPRADQPQYPIRLQVPELEEGPHFGYAIQWFSFACIAVVGWSALLLTRRGRRGEQRTQTFR